MHPAPPMQTGGSPIRMGALVQPGLGAASTTAEALQSRVEVTSKM